MRKVRNICSVLLLLLQLPYASGQGNFDIEKIDDAVGVILCYDNLGHLFSYGSCFVINSEGVLITNYHVLKNVYRAEIKFENDEVYDLDKIIGENEEIDLVKFTIKKNYANQTFPCVKISYDLPKKLSEVIAIGTPANLNNINRPTKGNVALIHYGPKRTIIDFDANIAHGSSGGALFNTKGEVIGVTSGGDVSEDGARASINFAIWIGELEKLNPVNISRIYDDALIPVKISFYITFAYSNDVSLYIDGRAVGFFKAYFNHDLPNCGQDGTITTYLSKGYHQWYAFESSTNTNWKGDFTINTNECFLQGLDNKPNKLNASPEVYVPYSPPAVRNLQTQYDWMFSSGLSFVNTGRGVPFCLYLEKYFSSQKYSIRVNLQYLKKYQDFSKDQIYKLNYFQVGVDFKRIFKNNSSFFRFWNWYIAASLNIRSNKKDYSRPIFLSNGIYKTSYLDSVNNSVGLLPAFRFGIEVQITQRICLSTDASLGLNTNTKNLVGDLNILLGYRLNTRKKE